MRISDWSSDVCSSDLFALDARTLADCAGVYDRAALIALPRPMRDAYVGDLHARLPAGCRGLLVTHESPPHEKSGPPFPLDAVEVKRLYGHDWENEQMEPRTNTAAEPSLAEEGGKSLHTAANETHGSRRGRGRP